MTRPAKRSLTIAGHRTSISLEEPFWEGLCDIAESKGTTISRLVADIDSTRTTTTGLSGALRIAVLEYYKSRAAHQPRSK